MKTVFSSLLSCFLLAACASAQQCQIAVGVSSSNTACSEDIVEEIKLYSQIVYRDECGTTPSNRRKLLRGEQEDGRELQSQQQCDTWQYFCTIGYNPQYYCQAYQSCLRRDLREEEQETKTRTPTRQLSAPTEDPLNDAGWEPCVLSFGKFVKDVDDNFMAGYATSETRECWKHMWCRVKTDPAA